MNLMHNWLCRSSRWKHILERRLPWVLQDLALGSKVLEIGPGFGATTDLIHPAVESLTCVEMDRRLAERLRRRMRGTNVNVMCEDATSMSLPSAGFDAVVCFTMLHHVSSPALQDRLFTEAARVLRPGGVFAGSDSLSSRLFRMLHLFDTMVVVDPHTLPGRLRSAGFSDIEVDVNTDRSAFRFRARRPSIAA
jgi:SAM-dependent methyltransferase